MDLFLIILAGSCLIGLAIYWIRLWREERDRKHAKALRQVADEKAAVRGLAHQRAPEFTRAEAQKLMDNFRDVYPRIVAVYQRARDNSQLSSEEAKAMKAMDWGVDDSRWEPGTTAVDALIKERDDLQHQVASLKNVNESLAKVATTEQSRSIQRTLGEIRSDSVTHALATAMPWFAVRYDGIHFACSHEVRLNAAGSVWELRNATAEFDGTYKLVILEKIDTVGWRDSLLHYNQITRMWEKPA